MQAAPTASATGASAEAIRSHYDVGTDFYRLWLDPSLSYSCALWHDDDTLESAQARKLQHHVSSAHAHGAARVLDVGCGWGALLDFMVESCGVKQAVGLTLSADQARHVREKRRSSVQVELCSWDQFVPEQPFDAIVSIGAFEHFVSCGHSSEEKLQRYRQFFERCHSWLLPGGRLSLQSITYERASAQDFSQFFANEVFPESDLPRPWEVLAAADGLFEVVELRMDRMHYARTLQHWYRRLRAARQQAEALVGADVVARYEQYLQMCWLGFHSARMNLMRVALRRLDTQEPK